MTLDLDLGKIVMGFIMFAFTLYVNRNMKQIDSMNDKIDRLSNELSEIKGAITNRFVIGGSEKRGGP